jgi:CRP-like cAMP-binding protein
MAPDMKRELLRKVPMLAALRSRDLDAVERLADQVDLPAGQVLMREGETGNEMFIMVSGAAKVERGGQELGRSGAGDVLGEIALVSEGPRMATVTLTEPSTLLVIGHREFHSLLDASPDLTRAILNALGSRIRVHEVDQPH